MADKKALTIRLDPDLDKALREMADERRRTLNSVVTEAIADWIAKPSPVYKAGRKPETPK